MTTRKRGARAHVGFTLIEALIALVVFAIMATLGYRGLSAVLDARQQLAAESKKWRDLTLFFLHVENDMNSVVQRPIRNTYGQAEAALVGTPNPVGDTDGMLTFSRLGTPGTTGMSAAITRMSYRLRNNQVEMLVWPAADAAPRATPKVYPLLSNIGELKITYLDATTNQWQTQWTQIPTASVLPAAIRLELALSSGVRFNRVFAIPPAL